MVTRLILGVVLLLLTLTPYAQQPPAAWTSWRWLLGDWVGEGGGQPGEGSGWFSFHPDLQGKVLVRRNQANYPHSEDRPAYTHDDLMVVYVDPATKSTRADYFDNEGHVIRYAVTVSDDGKTFIFLSPSDPAGPRYRLSYHILGADNLSLKFEIAPPGSPNQFATYIEAKARRKPGAH